MEVFASVLVAVLHLFAASHVACVLNYHRLSKKVFVAGILMASLNGAAAIIWTLDALDNLGVV